MSQLWVDALWAATSVAMLPVQLSVTSIQASSPENLTMLSVPSSSASNLNCQRSEKAKGCHKIALISAEDEEQIISESPTENIFLFVRNSKTLKKINQINPMCTFGKKWRKFRKVMPLPSVHVSSSLKLDSMRHPCLRVETKIK